MIAVSGNRGELILRAERLNDPDATENDIALLLMALELARTPELQGVGALITTSEGSTAAAAAPATVGDLYRPTTLFPALELPDRCEVVIAGRMLLPGHPVIDFRRYELGFFTVERAGLPDWFPAATQMEPPRYFFAEIGAATRGFDAPSVFGLFSELVTPLDGIENRPQLALLLSSRVERMYRDITGVASTVLGRAFHYTPGPRTIALQAHEWGHFIAVEPYQESLRSVDDNPVLEEWLADARAIRMLAASTHPDAADALEAMLLDKLLRQAWYPVFGRRPDATASRALVRAGLGCGAIREHYGRWELDMRRLVDLVAETADDPAAVAAGILQLPPDPRETAIRRAYETVLA